MRRDTKDRAWYSSSSVKTIPNHCAMQLASRSGLCSWDMCVPRVDEIGGVVYSVIFELSVSTFEDG